MGQIDRLHDDLIGDEDAVIGLIVALDTPEDVLGLGQGGLVDDHRLEAALQSGVLFNILAVLLEGGGTDHLNLTTGQGGLENVGGIHGAFGIASAHQIVYLVDDQNDVAQRLDLFDQALHTAFELTAELGTCHHGGHVQQPDFLVLQLIGNLAPGNFLCQTFGYGSLTHAGLADEAGIVLLAAVEDLDDPQGLAVAANHPVQLAFPGLGGQIHGIIVEEFLLVFGLFTAFSRFFLGFFFGFSVLAEQIEQGESRCAGGGLLVALLLFGQIHGVHPHLLHNGRQALAQRFGRQTVQIAVLQAEFIQKIGNRLDAQLFGTLEAQAFVDRLSVFQFGDKNHCHILFAAGADRHTHVVVIPPMWGDEAAADGSPAADS